MSIAPLDRLGTWCGESTSASSDGYPDTGPALAVDIEYTDDRYDYLLGDNDVFMRESSHGVSDLSLFLCQELLTKDQDIPNGSRFDDDIFELSCEQLRGRNKARLVQDLARLIVPAAETFALRNSEELGILAETVDEGWDNCVPITEIRPQPDYSVGFTDCAFAGDRLNKLLPLQGTLFQFSYIMATYWIFFPFLTCETKETGFLNVADRQNAHSMAIAVRAIVELFKLVKREGEVNREILSFSVSHDDQNVLIYGHYAVIDGPTTRYYRHLIRELNIKDGRERWTTYKFTKNVYKNWVPMHLKRVCSAIDDLPEDYGPKDPSNSSVPSTHISPTNLAPY